MPRLRDRMRAPLSGPLCQLFKIGGHGNQFSALFRSERILANGPLAEQPSKRQHLVVVELGGKVVSIASMGKRWWISSHGLGWGSAADS